MRQLVPAGGTEFVRSEWSNALRRGGNWLGSGAQETGDGGVDGEMRLVVEAEEHG